MIPEEIVKALKAIGMEGEDPVAFLKSEGLENEVQLARHLTGDVGIRLEVFAAFMALLYLRGRAVPHSEMPVRRSEDMESCVVVGNGDNAEGGKVLLLGFSLGAILRLIENGPQLMDESQFPGLLPGVAVMVMAALDQAGLDDLARRTGAAHITTMGSTVVQ